jgi:hypothetical protein
MRVFGAKTRNSSVVFGRPMVESRRELHGAAHDGVVHSVLAAEIPEREPERRERRVNWSRPDARALPHLREPVECWITYVPRQKGSDPAPTNDPPRRNLRPCLPESAG